MRVLTSGLLLQEWRIGFLIVLADLRVARAEVIDAAYVDLASRIFGEVVHDVISHVLNSPVAAERDAADWVCTNMIKESDGNGVTNIFEDLLSERWTVRVRVDLGVGIGHRSLFFDVPLCFDELWSKRIYSLAVMVIALEGVAIGQTGRFLQSHTTGSIPAHAILIFD